MTPSMRETFGALFFDGAETSGQHDISIDVLDSWSNSGVAAVAPTTISWCDGRTTAAEGIVVA
ncbi:MAG TPA: hypothetical protein VHH15_19060 [Actinophytocola sp.]|nr:hypothetical protein [Actinophytocola sp.]